jgi:unsaturated chondroitin disaccharide hydrolase
MYNAIGAGDMKQAGLHQWQYWLVILLAFQPSYLSFAGEICTVDRGVAGIACRNNTIDASGRQSVHANSGLSEVGVDLNADGIVNGLDLAILAVWWQHNGCSNCGGADLTGDGDVDWKDLGQMRGNWLVPTEDLEMLVVEAIDFASSQLEATVANPAISTGDYPYRTAEYANWLTASPSYWGSGFFPGCLWLMYEANQETGFRQWAEDWTAGLEEQASTSILHDIGFIIYTSFGNGYRLTGNTSYRDVMLQAADTLSDLYNPTVGFIELGWGRWQCPMGIDTLMNLEMLFWAAREGGNTGFSDMAISHCYKTIEYLLRPDGSTYHIADYDLDSGTVTRLSFQGHSMNSTWSRGQAWAVYGFTIAYRETGDLNLLNAARQTADYFIDNLPTDCVPFWDFDAPGIPETEKDSSAAAIAARGLLELGTLVNDLKGRLKYCNAARRILLSLCRTEEHNGYLAQDPGETSLSTGILMHGCHHHQDAAAPGHEYVDESLIWGDYYLLEALLYIDKP